MNRVVHAAIAPYLVESVEVGLWPEHVDASLHSFVLGHVQATHDVQTLKHELKEGGDQYKVDDHGDSRVVEYPHEHARGDVEADELADEEPEAGVRLVLHVLDCLFDLCDGLSAQGLARTEV